MEPDRAVRTQAPVTVLPAFLGFEVWGLGFWVGGFGFGVWGVGSGVWGLGAVLSA